MLLYAFFRYVAICEIGGDMWFNAVAVKHIKNLCLCLPCSDDLCFCCYGYIYIIIITNIFTTIINYIIIIIIDILSIYL